MNIAFIGGALGYGSPRDETFHGPEELKKAGLVERIPSSQWRTTITSDVTQKAVSGNEGAFPFVYDVTRRLAAEVSQTLKDGDFPCTLGGDHSLAIGTWSGVIGTLKAQRHFGLIWIDAHMDSHTPLTTPSQAIHGMPLAALLGRGREEFVNLFIEGPKLDPRHVVMLGARSFEEGEESLLKSLGVRIFYDKEIKERGFEACFKDALQIVEEAPGGFGISLDLDAFDPSIAPGVGSPAGGGLFEDEVLSALESVASNPLMKAFEVVEFNPHLDENHKTRDLTLHLLGSVFKKNAQREDLVLDKREQTC